jgi:membrane fusion protein, copper/silver efflux system
LDTATRSAKARIVMPGHLAPIKPGMYATVYLTSSAAAPEPVIPEEALIRTGEEEWVILALGEGKFRPVKVRAGLASSDRVQILDGLQGDEQVVAGAQFLIDSEARLRGAFGSMVATDTPPQIDPGGPMNMPGEAMGDMVMEMGTDPSSQTEADSMRSQR